jgi:serine/threonine protein kinase/tetratricopeptide (TPR) repeat protein
MTALEDQARSLFLAALGRVPEHWPAFLDQACSENAALRARVEQLLHAHQALGSIHGGRATAPGASVEDGPVAERPGKVIGRYKLLEAIGEGGMGSVWMAQQTEPVKRLVAVKLIKAGMDSTQVIGRFEAERQALALMDHPNIARVLDGGVTDSGRPYFVMELVKAVPITAFCDERRLTPRQRLELFAPVCAALQHAHQKGVIHRDVKPSNVLVALYDGTPVVKVIDFGVAKAIGQQLTEQTLHTGFGAIVGTLEYMSPEQASFNQLDIDTRSDIYSLGVLLYELFTGSPPFSRQELEKGGVLEMLRVIREQEPTRPSTKLSTAEGLPTLAANRGTEPAKLTRLVRGDLDWIVMKALEKDRNRRYESASALAADVQRYLHDEPVLACPPSAGYRLGKFVRRHRGAVFTATTAVVLLAAGVVGTGWGLLWALREHHNRALALEAEVKAKRSAERSLDTLTEDVVENLLSRQPTPGETEKAFLRKVLGLYDEFTRELGETESARAVRANGFHRVATVRAVLGELADAEAAFDQALELRAGLAADFPGVPRYRYDLAWTRESLALLWRDQGQLDRAEGGIREALELRTALVEEFPDQPEYLRQLARGFGNLAGVLILKGRFPEAATAHRQALALRARQAAQFPAEPRYQSELAKSYAGLGVVLEKLGQRGDAETAYREALARWTSLTREFPEDLSYLRWLGDCQNELGLLLLRSERFADAEPALREALRIHASLAADHPTVPHYRHHLAVIHMNLGDLLDNTARRKDAEEAYGEALPILRRLAAAFPASPLYHRDLAKTSLKLARMLTDPKQAEAAYREALTEQAKVPADSPDDPEYREVMAETQLNFGSFLQKRGRTQEAAAAWQAALPVLAKLHEDHPEVSDYAVKLGGLRCNLGIVAVGSGARQEALECFDKAIATLEPVRARDPQDATARTFLRNSYWSRADTRDTFERFAEAAKDWEAAVELSPPADQPALRVRRAFSLVRAGDRDRATQAAEEWVAAEDVKANHLYAAARVFALAAAGRDQPEVAERNAARAVELLRRAYDKGYRGNPDIKNDKFLESLRGRDDFKKLLAEREARKIP